MKKRKRSSHGTKARPELESTDELLQIVHRLRKECPWDRKQTHQSLTPYLLEEAHETVEAIEQGNPLALCEELGDVLLQVVLHAEIACEKNKFDFSDIARAIGDKMIRRHPHVFGQAKYRGIKNHLNNWTQVKKQERKQKNEKEGSLDGIPRSMPALQLAQRYGEIAGSIGFDWPSVEGVLQKVQEECRELEIEIRKKKRNQAAIEMELGDVLFTISNLARHLSVDGESALRKSSLKFHDRFSRLEKQLSQKGKQFSDFGPEALEEMWQRLKRA